MKPIYIGLLLLLSLACVSSLLPPKFQWKFIEYAWKDDNARDEAIKAGDYIPENNMPAGLARWKNKLFVVVPRWKKGVVSSLNYVNLNGPEAQPLRPYPSWSDGYVSDNGNMKPGIASVVSAFRVHVDKMDRLWVVDNGVSDMSGEAKELGPPAIVVFDLNTDQLIRRFVLPQDVFTPSTVLSSIAVDVPTGRPKKIDPLDTYAFITDMGSKCIIVYSMKDNTAWRVENELFHADLTAGDYSIGGLEFYWHDGVSSAILVPSAEDKSCQDLYFHPTSSTKLFKISTRLLKNKNVTEQQITDGVQIVGDRGPKSQASACDYDKVNKVIFYTQLSKNGIGCWNVEKPCTIENNPVIISDCCVLEFPNDVKVDNEGNIWILSDRQSRFLYGSMDIGEFNFRILTAPTKKVIEGSQCAKKMKKLKSSSSSATGKCGMNSSCSAATIR